MFQEPGRAITRNALVIATSFLLLLRSITLLSRLGTMFAILAIIDGYRLLGVNFRPKAHRDVTLYLIRGPVAGWDCATRGASRYADSVDPRGFHSRVAE